MKRRILIGLMIIITFCMITGCTKKEEKKEKNSEMKSSIQLEEGAFSIVCNSKVSDSDGISSENETTYNFNENQYVKNYAVVTTQSFKDESVYRIYKETQEETVKASSNEEILYDLQSNDKTKSLVFTMAVIDINIEDAETEEEKESLKAKEILERLEGITEVKYECELKNIDRSELK